QPGAPSGGAEHRIHVRAAAGDAELGAELVAQLGHGPRGAVGGDPGHQRVEVVVAVAAERLSGPYVRARSAPGLGGTGSGGSGVLADHREPTGGRAGWRLAAPR